MRKSSVRPACRLLAVLLATLLSLNAAAATEPGGAGAAPPDASARPFSRLAVVDWGLAATVLALGITPLAVADSSGYRRWVQQPALPPGIHDLGLRNQPNLERLSRLHPDLILTNTMFGAGRARLERIAPTHLLDVFTSEAAPYRHAIAVTRRIARLTGRQAAGEALIDRVEQRFVTARTALQHVHDPVYVVQFSDARHVRVFGQGSLLQTALDRTGLRNAWQGPTNTWGFANIGIEVLAQVPEARLIVLGPLPQGTAAALADSQLWRHLPSVERHQVYSLPPVWTFGALPSLERFTLLLQQALSVDDVAALETAAKQAADHD